MVDSSVCFIFLIKIFGFEATNLNNKFDNL